MEKCVEEEEEEGEELSADTQHALVRWIFFLNFKVKRENSDFFHENQVASDGDFFVCAQVTASFAASKSHRFTKLIIEMSAYNC